jgi:hypothetical protein
MTLADGIAILISVVSLAVSGYVASTARASKRLAEKAINISYEANEISRESNTMSQTANAYARESNVIAQRVYEAENVPRLDVEVRPIIHYDAREIGPDDPRQGVDLVLRITIRNIGKLPLTISNVLLVNAEKEIFRALPRVHGNKDTPFPTLP